MEPQDHLLDLYEAVLGVADQADVDRVLQTITERAREIFDAELGALGVPNEDRTALERFFHAGVNTATAKAIGDLPTGRGVLGIMLEDGRALRLDDVAGHPRAVGLPPHHPPVRSLLGVPIPGPDGPPLGDLYVANRRSGAPFTPRDEEVLRQLARHASVALRYAHLMRQVATSEQRYRMLTENAPDLVFALDHEAQIVFANHRAADVLGVAQSDVLGRPLRTLFVPADRAVVDLSLRALEQGRTHVSFAAATNATADEEARHLDVSIVPGGGAHLAAQGIARDVTAQRSMAREFAARTNELLTTREERERLRGFVSLVMQAQEDERARIAGDLHDTTVQTLTAIGRRLRALTERAQQPGIGAELEELADAAMTEADEVRRLSRNLRPSVLDHLGLDAALSLLVHEMEADGVAVQLHVASDPPRLDDRQRTTLFRIAQEALTNVRRHSGARRVDIALGTDGTHLCLRVRDDGAGFDAEAVEKEWARSRRLGLAGMRERAGMLGGTLEISSRVDEGTTVTARLPLDA